MYQAMAISEEHPELLKNMYSTDALNYDDEAVCGMRGSVCVSILDVYAIHSRVKAVYFTIINTIFAVRRENEGPWDSFGNMEQGAVQSSTLLKFCKNARPSGAFCLEAQLQLYPS